MEMSRPPTTLAAMDTPLTEPLRRRRRELRTAVDELPETAARLRDLDLESRGAVIAETLDFLRGELALHAEAEEMWLYPAVARRLGHPAATQTMAMDHRLLRERVDALAKVDVADVQTLERLLYGIHALLDAHFRKEEDAYLPLLEYEDLTEAVAAVDVGMRQHEHGLDVGVTDDVVDLDAPKFPESRSDGAKLAYLVRYAVRAPSNHNSQPWRFRLAGDTLSLFADRTRALPVVDSDDRELLMSCGAALLHLRVAARHFGHALDIDLLPDPADHDLLARIELHDAARPTYEEKLLFLSTSHRRTNRQAFESRPLPDGLAEVLARAAEEEDAWLSLVEGEAERAALAELVSEDNVCQLHDPSFRRELAAWAHPTRMHAKDGMPSYALRVPALLSKFGPFALRTSTSGKGSRPATASCWTRRLHCSCSGPPATRRSIASAQGWRSGTCSCGRRRTSCPLRSSTSPSSCRSCGPMSPSSLGKPAGRRRSFASATGRTSRRRRGGLSATSSRSA